MRVHRRCGSIASILSAAAAAMLWVVALARPAIAQGVFTLSAATLVPDGTIGIEHVYNGFGCRGMNISPALQWSGAPSAAQSFAVTMFDPDARSGAGWWHWLVYDIPATVTELPRGAGNRGGALPAGATQARTDFGDSGYGGPCPPEHDKPHHYAFTVYALRTKRLDIPAGSAAAAINTTIRAYHIGAASFTALYGR